MLLWHIALQGLDTSEQTQVAEVLGSNVYTVEDDDPPPPSEDSPVKNLSHSASSDTLKEVRVHSSPSGWAQECVHIFTF